MAVWVSDSRKIALSVITPLGAAALVRELGVKTFSVMNFFFLILGGLAAYRLALLVSKEDGPAYIFRRLRHMPTENSAAKEGLSCEWCMSVWAGALVAGYMWLIGLFPGAQWPLYWLAISALAIIFNQQWTREH